MSGDRGGWRVWVVPALFATGLILYVAVAIMFAATHQQQDVPCR